MIPATAELPVEIRNVQAGGMRLRTYCVVPEQPTSAPLIALHGFGTTGERTFRHVAPHLYDAGVPLYAPDLPGAGDSEKPDIAYSLHLLGHVFADFVRQLGLEQPALLGHSMGGRIAAATAALNADLFSRLILVNAGGFARTSRFIPYLAGNRMVSEMLANAWFCEHVLGRTPLGPVFAGEEARSQTRHYRRSHFGLDLDRAGIRRLLPQLRTPVMLLWGEKDRLVPLRRAHDMMRDFPSATLRLISGAGHAPMKDQPEAFSAAVASFIRNSASAKR